ncbi:MAG: hypothetical protein NZL87_10045, partial [Thermomicrobium sp.]|nr:hypothetical protein [Thermomicrobium sp.]
DPSLSAAQATLCRSRARPFARRLVISVAPCGPPGPDTLRVGLHDEAACRRLRLGRKGHSVVRLVLH